VPEQLVPQQLVPQQLVPQQLVPQQLVSEQLVPKQRGDARDAKPRSGGCPQGQAGEQLRRRGHGTGFWQRSSLSKYSSVKGSMSQICDAAKVETDRHSGKMRRGREREEARSESVCEES